MKPKFFKIIYYDHGTADIFIIFNIFIGIVIHNYIDDGISNMLLIELGIITLLILIILYRVIKIRCIFKRVDNNHILATVTNKFSSMGSIYMYLNYEIDNVHCSTQLIFHNFSKIKNIQNGDKLEIIYDPKNKKRIFIVFLYS